MKYEKDHIRLAAELVRSYPGVSPADSVEIVSELVRVSRRMRGAAIRLCNIPDYQERFNKVFKWGRARVHALLMSHALSGLMVEYNSDGRGSAVRLELPSGAGNCGFDRLWHIN